jgi:hypothetical protein
MFPARATFAYEAVPTVTAAALRAQAGKIRNLIGSTTVAIIEAGNDLRAARQHLKGAQFRDWVEAECGFSLRTAQNYIAAAKYAEGKSATVALLNPGVVYKLAAKWVPPEIGDAAMQRAAKGDVVADRDVSAALGEAKFQKREVERQQKKSTRRAESKKIRERNERARLQQEDVRRAEDERVLAIVLSIIERLGEENAGFLIDKLGRYDHWTIIDRLGEEVTKRRRQVAA